MPVPKHNPVKGLNMIKGLSEYEKYKVIRPIIGNCEYDKFGMPIIKRTKLNSIDWENTKIIGIQNVSVKTSDSSKIIMMFNYDAKLISLWNAPLKKIGLFQGFAAVCSPDFSIYPDMNINEIRHNIYMSRWLGVTWQNYGCTVLPTIGWAKSDTYDICFSGLEYESIVVISTIGCKEHVGEFLAGFRELKKRINPPLIIVFGDMIEGMTGTFINYNYNEMFTPNKRHEQMCIDGIPRIFTIKEVA